jgi:hypothetical protein
MLFYLFEFISPCISSLFLSEISFSNNQMVSIRSGEGQDIPPVVRAHIANQQNQAPPRPSTQQWIQYATVPCRSDAANRKPDYHYSKQSSSAKEKKSVTTSSITSTGGQA